LRANVSEDQIVDETGWSPKRVRRLLAGQTRLLAEDMEKWARVLRKPVADLYRDPQGVL